VMVMEMEMDAVDSLTLVMMLVSVR
jgi:hypothetical protein